MYHSPFWTHVVSEASGWTKVWKPSRHLQMWVLVWLWCWIGSHTWHSVWIEQISNSKTKYHINGKNLATVQCMWEDLRGFSVLWQRPATSLYSSSSHWQVPFVQWALRYSQMSSFEFETSQCVKKPPAITINRCVKEGRDILSAR